MSQNGSQKSEALEEHARTKEIADPSVLVPAIVVREGLMYLSVPKFKDGEFIGKFQQTLFCDRVIDLDHVINDENVITYMVAWPESDDVNSDGSQHVRQLDAASLASPTSLRKWAANNQISIVANTPEAVTAFSSYIVQLSKSAKRYYRLNHALDETYGIVVGAKGYIDATGVPGRYEANTSPLRFNAMCKDGKERHFLVVDPLKLAEESVTLDREFLPGMQQPQGFSKELAQASVDTLGSADTSFLEPPERMQSLTEARETLMRFLDLCYQNHGNHVVTMCLGYYLAHAARSAFAERSIGFPHLTIYGRKAEGKSQLARLCHNVAKGNTLGITEATRSKAFARNTLSHQSIVPVLIEEMHNIDAQETLHMVIKAAYDSMDMGYASSGAKVGNNIKHRLQRSMVLVGEAVVGNDAEISRCCLVRMEKPVFPQIYHTHIAPSLPEVQKAWQTLLCDRENMKFQLLRAREVLMQGTNHFFPDSRVASNWAIIGAGIGYLFTHNCGDEMLQAVPPQHKEMWAMAMEHWEESVHNAVSTSEDLGVLPRFLNDAELAYASGFLVPNDKVKWILKGSYSDTAGDHDVIGIKWSTFFSSVYSRKNAPFLFDKLMNEVKQRDKGYVSTRRMSYFVGQKRQQQRVECYSLLTASLWLPTWLLDLADRTTASESNTGLSELAIEREKRIAARQAQHQRRVEQFAKNTKQAINMSAEPVQQEPFIPTETVIGNEDDIMNL